jgi:hypothetical protein
MEKIASRFILWLSTAGTVFVSLILTKEYEKQFYATQEYATLDKWIIWIAISSALITLSVAVFAWTMRAIKDL